MLKNIQSVTTGNTFTTSPIKGTDTGITALYCRLSQDDGNVGDSDSIINQKSGITPPCYTAILNLKSILMKSLQNKAYMSYLCMFWGYKLFLFQFIPCFF